MARARRDAPQRTQGYHIGADIATERDYAALTTLWVEPAKEPGTLPDVHVRDLARVRGTDTPSLVAEIARLVAHLGGAVVALDLRGPGRGVFDGLKLRRLKPIGINTTSGATENAAGLVWNVPSEMLFQTTYEVFSAGRFKIAEGLELSETLLRELTQVRAVRTPSGYAKYELPRSEEGHGDLAASLLFATYVAEVRVHRVAMSHVIQEKRRERRKGRSASNTARDVIKQRKAEREMRWAKTAGDLWAPLGFDPRGFPTPDDVP